MSSIAPRIAYVGLPLGALALAHAGHRPVAVALGHPDAPGARRVMRWRDDGVAVLEAPDLRNRRAQAELLAARPDALFSWFWPKQLPAALLAQFPRGAFGVHPSLLPAFRGPDPYFWVLLAGERETGVTLHRLEAEYDTGAIIAQERLAIAAADDAWRLAKRLDRPSLRLLTACARRLAAGETLAGEPQDDGLASEAPRPSDDELAIVWDRPSRAIVRLVRAAAPFPGASAELGGELVEVVRAASFEGALPAALLPAEAVHVLGRGVVVRCRDGGVLLERVRRASGEELRGEAVAALFAGGITQL
jgi:methionyl-tRNA formyltransferase